MLLTAEQKCYLWLSAAEVTSGHVQKLLEQYETPLGIWDAFGSEHGPVFKPVTNGILKSLHSRDAMDDLQEKLNRKNVHLLFRGDPEYPYLLDSIQDPPYLLYYAGRLTCLQKPMVALVGTRHPSQYGKDMASLLARGLCDAGVCVVSGLARGIDGAVHEAALRAEGSTIGVLGSGINVPYPPEHTPLLRKIASGIGLIISEYPLDSDPKAFHFPHRNRIISGLSQGVVFVEGRIKSGGMHTVNAALMQGREVFAVPGYVGTAGSEGPHAILREGARIVTSAEDILDDLGLAKQEDLSDKEKLISLTSFQNAIVSQLRLERLTPQELAQKLQCDASELIAELGTLEILGVISREAGNRFYLPLAARL